MKITSIINRMDDVLYDLRKKVEECSHKDFEYDLKKDVEAMEQAQEILRKVDKLNPICKNVYL